MTNNAIEKLVKTITYKGVEFEVVERPDVIWVGCADYAGNNSDESDTDATRNRYYKELSDVAKKDLINPDYAAGISMNYARDDKPCGMMVAQETYSSEQDGRYELFTETAGLWLRVQINEESDNALFGRGNHGMWEYYAEDDAPIQSAAKSGGYIQNPDVDIVFEYYHNSWNGPNYVYIPIGAE
ncbi:MAG: hypothetical protein FWC78_07755 [Defluviitaleaceae bacterium]|nr:hypothetical protein [Defluviitaleaceae bacterium]